MIQSSTRYDTPNGSKYLQQLCKHFAHKVTVDYDDAAGRADLPPGPASMQADATELGVTITAQDADGLALAKYIIEDHLKRFAFREEPDTLIWADADVG